MGTSSGPCCAHQLLFNSAAFVCQAELCKSLAPVLPQQKGGPFSIMGSRKPKETGSVKERKRRDMQKKHDRKKKKDKDRKHDKKKKAKDKKRSRSSSASTSSSSSSSSSCTEEDGGGSQPCQNDEESQEVVRRLQRRPCNLAQADTGCSGH